LHLALTVATYVAAQTQNIEIADAVVDLILEKVRAVTDGRAAVELVYRIIECAAADCNREAARKNLAWRLEQLAFRLPKATMFEFLDTLEVLQGLDNELATMLGRAIAAARLGTSQIVAS